MRSMMTMIGAFRRLGFWCLAVCVILSVMALPALANISAYGNDYYNNNEGCGAMGASVFSMLLMFSGCWVIWPPRRPRG